MLLVHGTCVDLDGIGVLIIGPPGSGKSDLAIRLIDAGARLVADDYLWLENADGGLVAAVPESIAGLLEVRGLGIVKLSYRDTCAVRLCVDLVAPDEIDRLPAAGQSARYEGVEIRRLALEGFEASAVAKVKLAARAVRDGIVVTE
jgi:serine kinase of HPr protein (carbohydrate metabolism regulator)